MSKQQKGNTNQITTNATKLFYFSTRLSSRRFSLIFKNEPKEYNYIHMYAYTYAYIYMYTYVYKKTKCLIYSHLCYEYFHRKVNSNFFSFYLKLSKSKSTIFSPIKIW